MKENNNICNKISRQQQLTNPVIYCICSIRGHFMRNSNIYRLYPPFFKGRLFMRNTNIYMFYPPFFKGKPHMEMGCIFPYISSIPQHWLHYSILHGKNLLLDGSNSLHKSTLLWDGGGFRGRHVFETEFSLKEKYINSPKLIHQDKTSLPWIKHVKGMIKLTRGDNLFSWRKNITFLELLQLWSQITIFRECHIKWIVMTFPQHNKMLPWDYHSLLLLPLQLWSQITTLRECHI